MAQTVHRPPTHAPRSTRAMDVQRARAQTRAWAAPPRRGARRRPACARWARPPRTPAPAPARARCPAPSASAATTPAKTPPTSPPRTPPSWTTPVSTASYCPFLTPYLLYATRILITSKSDCLIYLYC